MNNGILFNKAILILSPQAWGNMLLAKHHYAIELAKRGNDVYFLNPPDNHHWSLKKAKKRITIKPEVNYPNLFLVNQQLFFPYNIKFHSRKLYNRLVRIQIKQLLKVIPKEIEILWSFDLGNLFPMPFFDKKLYKVFHPVDEPRDLQAIQAALGADILFSVTTEIIEKYKCFAVPSFFINHGLADEFIQEDTDPVQPGARVEVGISGNLLRPDLDRKTLLRIIKENPDVIFHFYGSYLLSHSNIGASASKETSEFIETLEGLDQVVLHGVLKTGELARELKRMDALLICYDMQLDQSRGTNYHKVMEYLSTGKVIISNNITTYQKYPELLRMNASRSDNLGLPVLFKETIGDLERWNAEALKTIRKAFALRNTYQNQLDIIEGHISNFSGKMKSSGDELPIQGT